MTDMAERDVRDRILLATLQNVAFDGWVERAVKQGVEDAGYTPDMAFRAFPDGISEMIRHWSDYGDRRMHEEMASLDVSAMPIQQRVARAIRTRIEVYTPHQEAVRRTLAHLALPGNAGIAAQNLSRTIDAILYAAGDRSTDFRFYTKRALLLPVYVATILVWLDDESEDFQETWGFLARRIDGAMKLRKLQARLRFPMDGLFASLRRRHRPGSVIRRGHA